MARTRVPTGVALIRSKVKAPTIRYYGNISLLPAPPRTRSNLRNYDAADLRGLVFICHDNWFTISPLTTPAERRSP